MISPLSPGHSGGGGKRVDTLFEHFLDNVESSQVFGFWVCFLLKQYESDTIDWLPEVQQNIKNLQITMS